MPSVADIPTSPTMSKKRRRDDLESSLRTSSSHYTCEPQILPDDTQTRNIFPYPRKHASIKRQRIDLPSTHSHDADLLFTRPPLSDMTDRQAESALEKKLGGKSTGGKVDLSPCHICRRKPTEKRHLEDYADCEGCGERTCFICMRECKGLAQRLHQQPWHVYGSVDMDLEGHHKHGAGAEGAGERVGPWEKGGVESHRGMICSRCCVERGTEGEVWCLGCLRSVEVA
ncbi:uncharacterized protein PAC_03792 [Phialocephala subalpina]|uniref:Uncharacterized protein n=1 Tax=Phialocephala subalpina TaxID=576137 RepID=A0A1L7WMB5_9HELO|nr:uncharacterized protein PAC_03792 [Phialocephala subalpina]